MNNRSDYAKEVVLKQMYGLKCLLNTIDTKSEIYSDIIQACMPVTVNNYRTRIVFAGVGKNANIASKAAETFASLGIPSMALNVCHYSHGDAGFIGPNDVVIHLSRSGKTEEMQFMAKHLSRLRPDVKQILLHCNQNLTKTSDDGFDILFGVDGIVESDKNCLAPTTSTTVLLALIDSIGCYLSMSTSFTPEDFYSFHPGGSLGKMLVETTNANSRAD